MNKDYLDSLNKDQLETRIYDLENELRQEWYQEKIMKFETARKLEGEVAYCKALLENFKQPVKENDWDREIRLNPNFNQEEK